MTDEHRDVRLDRVYYRPAQVVRAVEPATEERKDGPADMRLELSFSSTYPVQRWLDGDVGEEVLLHGAENVDLDRLNNGGPVLSDHRNSVDNLHGVIERAWLDDDTGRAVVLFHDDERSRVVYSKARSGVLRNVSVGYRILRFTKIRDEDTDKITFQVDRWEPMEISMVPVPADPTVGVGRECAPYLAAAVAAVDPQSGTSDAKGSEDEAGTLAAARAKSPDPEDTRTINHRGNTMPDEDKTAATKAAQDETRVSQDEVREAAVTAERTRISQIREIARLYPQLESDAGKAIEAGDSADSFRAHALKVIHNAKPMPPAPSVGLSDEDARSFSVLRLLRALAFGNSEARYMREAAFELDVCAEAQRAQQSVGVKRIQGTVIPMEVLRPALSPRADGNMARAVVEKFPELKRAMGLHQRLLTAGTATDGAELVATDLLSGSFIDVLRNASFVVQAGATLLTDLNGNVAIPRKTSGSVAAWLATEGVSSAAQSEPQFDQVTMSPNNLAVYGEYSRQLLLQSSLAVEALVRSDLAAGMATEMDRAALYGSGASGQPTGVANQTGINTPTDFAAANPTWAEVVAMETAVAVDNALFPASMAYMLKPDMRGALKTTTKVASDAGAGFVWDAMAPASPLNGYPAWVTNQVVEGDLFFGYWPDLLIGLWGGLDVIVDPFTQARKGVIGVTNHQSADIAVRHPVAFAFNNDGV